MISILRRSAIIILEQIVSTRTIVYALIFTFLFCVYSVPFSVFPL
eukprot:UN08641